MGRLQEELQFSLMNIAAKIKEEKRLDKKKEEN